MRTVPFYAGGWGFLLLTGGCLLYTDVPLNAGSIFYAGGLFYCAGDVVSS